MVAVLSNHHIFEYARIIHIMKLKASLLRGLRQSEENPSACSVWKTFSQLTKTIKTEYVSTENALIKYCYTFRKYVYVISSRIILLRILRNSFIPPGTHCETIHSLKQIICRDYYYRRRIDVYLEQDKFQCR